MNDSRQGSNPPPKLPPPLILLERIAATVLMLVILTLGWIILVSSEPTWLRLPTLEMEVVLILGLLIASLLLVSAVALRQTRE